MINTFKNLFKTNRRKKESDLTPRGIKSTIKSDNHGSSDDYNKTWLHTYSHIRNFDKL